MDARELAETSQRAIGDGDFDTAASYLADNFQFSGPVPEPIGAQGWLGMLKVFRTAFPDIKYNFNTTGVEGNVVRNTNQLTGTHTGDLDLSFMGMGVIPATGKSFSNPVEEGEGTWEGDKIVSIHIPSVEGGGLMGLLSQLGIEPPPM